MLVCNIPDASSYASSSPLRIGPLPKAEQTCPLSEREGLMVRIYALHFLDNGRDDFARRATDQIIRYLVC